MSIFRVSVLLLLFITISGCVLNRSLKLSDTEKATFFDPPKDKDLASIYLTCGRQAWNGDYDDPHIVSMPIGCHYNLNGVKYSMVRTDELGRVNVPAGDLVLNNSEGKDPTKIIVVKPGEKILLVTDFNHIVSTVNMFGLVGVAVQAVADAANPPRKPLINVINPLIIYKNDFMNLVGMKEPVQVTVVKDEQ